MNNLRQLIIIMTICLIGVLLSSCSLFGGSQDEQGGEIITLYVGPELVECVGAQPQTCMQVRQSPDEPYQFFYSKIDGFDYEEGYEYELRVRVTDVENPPADALSQQYTLVEVVSKTPA